MTWLHFLLFTLIIQIFIIHPVIAKLIYQEINKSHTCWKCFATNISTSDHLRLKEKSGLRKPAIRPATTEPKSVKKMNPAMFALQNLSSLLRKDSTGGQSIVVTNNLEMKDFKVPVTKLDILHDGSFICLLGQKLVRYSHEGQILTEFAPLIPPRNFVVRNGKDIVVIDGEGIKVFDEKFLPLSQVNVNPQISLAECVGLAEDQDGNLATINVNASGGGITDKGSSNVFIINVVTGNLDRIIGLKPEALFATSTKSRCEFIAVKNRVFYVVGSYRHLHKL